MPLLILLAQLTTAQAPAPDAVRDAFAFLYAMPADTAAAPMGTWVLDTTATASAFDPSGVWRIVVTKLADTGDGLQLRELAGKPGTSPAELAAAAAGIQQLEGKISKAEAEASLEVTISIGHGAATAGVVVEGKGWKSLAIAGATRAERIDGHWVRAYDRELEAETERWSPAMLFVQFDNAPRAPGEARVAIIARGNHEMIDRVIKETRWNLLAAVRQLNF